MPKTEAAYQESEHHIPKATDQTGTLETSGTAGAAESDLRGVTAIFDEAEKQDLAVAARALDPEDDEVHHSLVNLPTGATIHHADPEEAKDRVLGAAKAAEKKSTRPSRRSPAEEQAAEEGDEGAQRAQAQREAQGAGKRG
jgi:hypothetical protein